MLKIAIILLLALNVGCASFVSNKRPLKEQKTMIDNPTFTDTNVEIIFLLNKKPDQENGRTKIRIQAEEYIA